MRIEDTKIPGAVSLGPGPRFPWPRLRRRTLRRALLVIVILFCLFCAATARLFIFPATGMPEHVDAIVVPGGPGDRIGTALNLARQDRARYVVISEAQYVPPSRLNS